MQKVRRSTENLIKSAKNVLSILTISHFTQHLYIGISVLYPLIRHELGLSYLELGIVVGLSSVASGFLQIVFSLLSRYVSRRFLLGVGNFFLSMGTISISLAITLPQFVTAKLIGAFGTAAQHPVAVSIISEKIDQHKLGSALGLHYGLAYIGNIVSPVLLISLSVLFSWRSALIFLAIPALVTSVTLGFYLRREPSAGTTVKGESLKKIFSSVLQNKKAVMIILAQSLFAGGTGQGALVTFTPSFLTEFLQYDQLTYGVLFSFMMLGGIIGPLLIGKYSDKFGYINTAMGCAIFAAFSTFLITFFNAGHPLIALNLFLIGFSGFSITSLLQASISSFFSPSERTLVLGLFFTIGFGLSSIWSVLIGFLIEFSSFHLAYFLMSFLCLIAIFPLLSLKLFRVKPKKT